MPSLPFDSLTPVEPTDDLLVAGVIHDVRNLLTGVVLSSEVLLEGQAESQEIELNTIRNCAERAARLLEQVLGAMSSKKAPMENLELGEFVERLVPELQALIGRNCRLRTLCGNTSVPICINPDRLSQVLFNLVLNASQAMGSAGGSIVIRVGVRRPHLEAVQAGGFACLEVIDTGPGIPDEVRARMFEPFYTTKKTSGTGLGLALVRAVVRAAGGHIEVHSSPEAGTSFRVLLPLLMGQSESEDYFSGPSILTAVP